MSGLDFGSLSVLVIDNQEFVRTIVRKMLGQIGIIRVIEAADGTTGLDIARAEKPDVVICDVQMRPLDGFGFIELLRATPAISTTPVIMLTARADAAAIARARDLSVGAFLSKPVLPPALRDKITQVLSAR